MQNQPGHSPFEKEAAHLITEPEFAEGDIKDALREMKQAQQTFESEKNRGESRFIRLDSPETIQTFYENHLRNKETHAALVQKLESQSPALKRDFRLIRAQQMISDILPFDTSKQFNLLDESSDLALLLKKKHLSIGNEPFHVNGIRAFAGAAELLVRKAQLYYPDPTFDALLGVDAIAYDDEEKRYLLVQVKSANIQQSLPLIVPADEFMENAIDGEYNRFLSGDRKEQDIRIAEKLKNTSIALSHTYPKEQFEPLMWFMPVGEKATKYFDARTGLPREETYDKVIIP